MASLRAIAFQTLHMVERGAYASETLRAKARDLDPRDAALAEQIVMGVLRFRAQLDFLILHYSGRARKLDAEVRIALRMGIYQLRYLDRIPAHAAVTESVEAVKRARKASAAGFVNAVLRQVDRQPVEWPDRAVALSHPAWLIERWDQQYGVAAATAIARANLVQPEWFIRVPAGQIPPEGAEPCAEVAGCFLVPSAPAEGVKNSPRRGADTRVCRVETRLDARRILNPPSAPSRSRLRTQDLSSQCIVPLLELQPGNTFLDLCAAPGNKTAQALESGVRAVACDLHLHRLESLRDLAAHRVVLDGTSPLPFRGKFDRILVDAPCSGTGTLARNPEIKWRLTPADIADLQAKQKKLLAQALAVLAPGGRLVYSTCSVEPEENDHVVAAYPVTEMLRRIPGRDRGDGFFAAVLKSSVSAND